MVGYKPQLPVLSAPTIEEIVRRIVRAADPWKIVLFGSRARGDNRAESDIDLLVIADSSLPRHLRAVPLYAALVGLPVEVDTEVMVYTPTEVTQWQGVQSAFVTTALREGRVLYEKRP